ncbi:cytochrome P450 [Mycena olivaceomarginata]|nr:cytochrome P450 [Mycena olivaceomarginata]
MSSATVLVAAIVSVALYRVLHRKSGIENISGPPSPSWIFGRQSVLLRLYWPNGTIYPGNMLQLLLSPSYGDYEFTWLKLYGPIYRLKGCFRQNRLMVSDPLASQYILNSGHYQPIFEKMAQALSEQLEQSSASSINISPLLSTATLGAVSESMVTYAGTMVDIRSDDYIAVLGCSTQYLGEEFVANHYQIVQSAAQILTNALGALLPTSVFNAAGYLPTTAFRAFHKAKYLTENLGRRVVQDRMNAARQGLEIDSDVYSRLPECTGVRVGGARPRHTHFQDQLRVKIQSILGANPNNVPYDSMPLLNAFIKETLRFYPAVPLVDRVALTDEVIPIREDIKTSTEHFITQLHVRKGQLVTLAIASSQRFESFWGADSHEFKSQRWLEGSPYKGETSVGPYANLSVDFLVSLATSQERSKQNLGFGLDNMCYCLSAISSALPRPDIPVVTRTHGGHRHHVPDKDCYGVYISICILLEADAPYTSSLSEVDVMHLFGM